MRSGLPHLILLLALAAPAWAAGEEPEALDALFAAVGRPAEEAQVDAVLEDPRIADPGVASTLAVVLRTAGGAAAAEGLGRLLDRPEVEVRRLALVGLADLGLRSRDLLRRVRKAALGDETSVRVAAIDALGRMGDGRDLPGLLDGLSSEDGAVRSASLRALRTLTGTTLTASPGRWAQWWSKTQPTAQAELEEAIAAVTETPNAHEEADIEPHRATILRRGWVDLLAVETAARDWIRSTNDTLRAEGFRAVAALRLAGLADVVRSETRFRRSEIDAYAAADAARVLGLPPPRGASPSPER